MQIVAFTHTGFVKSMGQPDGNDPKSAKISTGRLNSLLFRSKTTFA